jgi:ABC-type lipoprotein release transport system permease subunit
MWLRIDVRRRWRSLTVLGLLIVLAGVTVVAFVAGARRGTSALPRLASVTLPATAAVLPNLPGFGWSRVEALPEVASVSTIAIDYELSVQGLPAGLVTFPPVNDTVLRSIEKPAVLAGRVFDPARDEAVVTAKFVAHYHLGVGDTFVLQLPTAKELAAGQGSGPGGSLTGPQLRTRIVGVIRSPWYSDHPDSTGGILLSPAVAKRYPANVIGDSRGGHFFSPVNALVRLRGGEAAIPQLRRDIARLTGRSDIDIWDLPSQYRDTQRQITFESRSLLALAAAAFVAAVLLIGQALARYTVASAPELQTLRALGMAPRQAVAAAAAGPALVALLSAMLAAAGAVIVAQWFPIGTAAQFEPAPGLSVDWIVIAPALAGIPLLVGGGAMVAAWAALGAARRDRPQRRSAIAAATARADLAAPVVVGVRFALESGRGRAAVPVRPALIGAITGVLGIVAAFTFSHAVSDAVAHPQRFGQTFQLITTTGFNSTDLGPSAKVIAGLDRLPAVTGVDDSRVAVATGPRDLGSVTLYEYSAGTKPVPVVVTSGRMPRAPDEVLLAPRTMSALNARIGSRVRLSGSKGSRTMRVTGLGLVPEGSHNSYADGGWVTPAGFTSLFTGFKYHDILVTLRPDAQGPDAGATLAAQVEHEQPQLRGSGLEFDDAAVPVEVAELHDVRVLPVVLGLFLALLAVGAVGHALASAVRRRAHDLAVLRALGTTRWQCRLIVVTQASVLALVGLVFGVPLGLVVGRAVWRSVADYTPVQYIPPVAVWVLLGVGPAALLAANLLAAWPGQRAARLRAAQVLRTE